MANKSLERQRIIGGRPVLAMNCVLAGAEEAPWWAAQQDRYMALERDRAN
jgi:hypothetical protein